MNISHQKIKLIAHSFFALSMIACGGTQSSLETKTSQEVLIKRDTPVNTMNNPKVGYTLSGVIQGLEPSAKISLAIGEQAETLGAGYFVVSINEEQFAYRDSGIDMEVLNLPSKTTCRINDNQLWSDMSSINNVLILCQKLN